MTRYKLVITEIIELDPMQTGFPQRAKIRDILGVDIAEGEVEAIKQLVLSFLTRRAGV